MHKYYHCAKCFTIVCAEITIVHVNDIDESNKMDYVMRG